MLTKCYFKRIILIIIVMKIAQLKTISQYNSLLNSLNPQGKYQISLYFLCCLYWMICGIYTTCFQMSFEKSKCPYALDTFQCFGILIFSWVSNLKGRKIGMLLSGLSLLLGYILCLIYGIYGSDARMWSIFGVSFIGLGIYSQPCLILSIICQITSIGILQLVMTICFAFYCIGRIAIIPLIQLLAEFQKNEDRNIDSMIIFCIILPLCLICIGLVQFANESPRYFIQTNIVKAEELIKKIFLINTGKEFDVTGISNIIDENFFIKRIHLRRYNFLTLFKYQSFGFSQYYTGICLFLLGIIGQVPSFLFDNNQIGLEDVQIYWISSFQFIGVLISYFFLQFCPRKITCTITSFTIVIVAITLFFLPQNQIHQKLVFIGLNSIFTMILFAFLIMNVIELYPHSVRLLGLSFMFSLYYLGQLAFLLYTDMTSKVKRPQDERSIILEVFLSGSILMALHCFGLHETYDKGFTYEIKQIEEQQNEEI